MANDYYIDTDGSGTSPYDTWAKAANNTTTTQDLLDNVTTSGTVHARGTLTLTAQLDIDQYGGTSTGGFIKFIGYNASGVNDGTRFIIDGNNAVTNVIYNNNMYYWWFENIEVKNSNGGDGFTGNSTTRYIIFLNCCANNCDVYGFDTYSCGYSAWIRCISYSNTVEGFGPGSNRGTCLFCRSRDNGQSGYDMRYNTYGTMLGCIADNNGNDGFENIFFEPVLFNCISDNNTDDGYTISNAAGGRLAFLFGCRITNHDGVGSIGVNPDSQFLLHGWNYYQNNDGANIQNDSIAYEIPYNGSGTDAEDQGDTESGYVDEANPEDYNLRDTATSRRIAISIPES